MPASTELRAAALIGTWLPVGSRIYSAEKRAQGQDAMELNAFFNAVIAEADPARRLAWFRDNQALLNEPALSAMADKRPRLRNKKRQRAR